MSTAGEHPLTRPNAGMSPITSPPVQHASTVAQNHSSFFISITPTTCLTYNHMKLCPDSHITYHHRLLPTDPPYVQMNAQTSIGFIDSTVEQRDQLNTRAEPQDQVSQNFIIVFPQLHQLHSTETTSASISPLHVQYKPNPTLAQSHLTLQMLFRIPTLTSRPIDHHPFSSAKLLELASNRHIR